MKREWTVMLAIWRKELIALSRDRHGLIALFLMPAAFILIMSMALKDAFSGGAENDVRYAVLDRDQTTLSTEFATTLEKRSSLKPLANQARQIVDEEGATKAVERQEIGVVVIVPPKFSESLLDAKKDRQLRLLIDPTLAPATLQAFRGAVVASHSQVAVGELSRRLKQLQKMIPARAGVKPIREFSELPAPVIETVGARQAQPSSVQQSVPAWLIFSMFFVVIPLSAIFIAERRDGTLQRLRSQQVSFAHVLAGKLIPFCLINQIQAVLMVLVGMYVVPRIGGEALTLPDAWLPLWLISLAVSVAAVGWALLVATATRTSEQATVIGGVGNILMGAIGGIMVPKMVMPASVQALTAFSPMAWALDGFHNVMLRQQGIDGILRPASALLAFAAATLVAAVVIHWRRNAS